MYGALNAQLLAVSSVSVFPYHRRIYHSLSVLIMVTTETSSNKSRSYLLFNNLNCTFTTRSID